MSPLVKRSLRAVCLKSSSPPSARRRPVRKQEIVCAARESSSSVRFGGDFQLRRAKSLCMAAVVAAVDSADPTTLRSPIGASVAAAIGATLRAAFVAAAVLTAAAPRAARASARRRATPTWAATRTTRRARPQPRSRCSGSDLNCYMYDELETDGIILCLHRGRRSRSPPLGLGCSLRELAPARATAIRGLQRRVWRLSCRHGTHT